MTTRPRHDEETPHNCVFPCALGESAGLVKNVTDSPAPSSETVVFGAFEVKKSIYAR